MLSKNGIRRGGVLLALVLVSLPATAGDGVVWNGIDTWRTTDDGSSYVDFADEPIPAGFFCVGSEPFAGRISWRGEPLVTRPEKALGDADTVVHRLDDAVFGLEDATTTRLRMAALSLVSLEPIRTSCGLFDVRASLMGEQPVTEMTIVREGAAGGYFLAPLELRVKLTFTPVDGEGETLELPRRIGFPATRIRWSSQPETRQARLSAEKASAEKVRLPASEGFVLIDTDGNGEVDTFLPGTSNFYPAGEQEVDKISTCDGPNGEVCHSINGTCHCVE